jgi:DNA-binding transcriptional LysR family regulator
MDWDKLKIFHAVAEAGSFTNATVNLNLSQSAISRQIQSLENDLKVQLFERHARGLTLTEHGEYVFKTARDVITKLKEVETSLGDQKNKPTGKLTITTVRSFGTHWLTPRIQEFMTLNPEIEIELIFDDKELDIKYYIYGSNKYLEKHGMPKTITDLNKHKFISFGKGAPSPVYDPDWALKLGIKDGKKRKPVMKVNSVMGLLLAVEAGVGLAALPEYLVSNSNNVIKVLPNSEGPITEAHFVYPQSLKNTARITAFRNFLFSKIGDWKS